MKNRIICLEGEYKNRGEYHKYLDPNWSYYPIYIRKYRFVKNFLEENINPSHRIIDIGCGEGVLVEEYRKKGYDIQGMDLNYTSDVVKRGDVRHIPFKNGYFNYVLCLDLIEHLNIGDQENALKEIYRVLDKRGVLIISIPNLAHLHSRLKFLMKGKFVRTANIKKHPGDRPIQEYIDLITNVGFKIKRRFGIKITLPPILDKLLRSLLPKIWYERCIYDWKYSPDLCFLNIVIIEKI